MHQKLLWGGAVVVVMGVTAGVFAVNYVARHPGSMLARLGVSVVTAGLNPNPLSDASCVAKANPSNVREEFGAEIGFQPPASERGLIEPIIEPIQIEVLPPPTKEPPIFEETEWRPLSRPAFPMIIDETPIWMPFADETLRTVNVRDAMAPLAEVVRSFGTTWFGLPWKQVGIANRVEQQSVYPGQQLIDPPGDIGNDSTLSWDHRELFDPSKCEMWCPLLTILRACCLPWLGVNWFEPANLSGQEVQSEPPVIDDPGQQLIDPPVRGWWRKGGGK